jgi:hypothetical protein
MQTSDAAWRKVIDAVRMSSLHIKRLREKELRLEGVGKVSILRPNKDIVHRGLCFFCTDAECFADPSFHGCIYWLGASVHHEQEHSSSQRDAECKKYDDRKRSVYIRQVLVIIIQHPIITHEHSNTRCDLPSDEACKAIGADSRIWPNKESRALCQSVRNKLTHTSVSVSAKGSVLYPQKIKDLSQSGLLTAVEHYEEGLARERRRGCSAILPPLEKEACSRKNHQCRWDDDDL